MFKPFAQADSSTQRSYGGSGLGLSICKALINVLNGRISLESQLGVGTTVSFTVTFVKATRAAAKSVDETAAAQVSDSMATWSSEGAGDIVAFTHIDLSSIPRDQLRVCVAEDNPINQKIAVSFVTKLGFKPSAYGDGLQAVEALRAASREKNPFHLVLMDCQMPVLDGYDATRLIRKDTDPLVRGVLIIAMTASAIQGDREKCLEAGMNNYLAKPVKAAVLKSMLEDYLKQPPKPIAEMQQKANETAKKILEDVKDAEREVKTHKPKTDHSRTSSRPTFTQRMNSRNNIRTAGIDGADFAGAPDTDKENV